MRKSWRAVVGAVVVLATIGGIAASDGPSGAPQPAAGNATPPGLVFRLSDGLAVTTPPERVATSTVTPLPDQEAQALIARLPALEPPAEGPEPFAAGEASLPPPRAGQVIREAFPPVGAGAAPTSVPVGPLTILRHAPNGAVPLAPHVSVTFSQPMVAFGSLDALPRAPVIIEPPPPGAWRWIGTQTAVFESASRLPMATDYRVEVPAGTTSATGSRLAKAEQWAFSTPPPTLVTKHPAGAPARLDPIFFAAFDQAIDPAVVLRTISVRAGGRAYRVRLAADDEIARDTQVARLTKEGQTRRWVAFRAAEPLPSNSEVRVVVGPGTPSAEGPKTTGAPQTWTFRTVGPLRVVRSTCGHGDACSPHTDWHIEFSNPIDTDLFADDMVTVTPPREGMTARVYDKTLSVGGGSKARTRYRVTLSPGLRDTFGQALGPAQPVTFGVGPVPARLWAPGREYVVLDPAAGPRFPVYSVGHKTLAVQVRRVGPEDWLAFQRALYSTQSERATPAFPGREVLSTTLSVNAKPDERVETLIDLAQGLPGGLGQAILVVEPTGSREPRWRDRTIVRWIQATRIGLDVFVDADAVVAWATSLDTGKPLANVEVGFVGSGRVVKTGPDGTARLPLDALRGPVVVARLGADQAMQRARSDSTRTADSLRWYVFNDRYLYRPGEEVKVKGWLRAVGAGPAGDLRPVGIAFREAAYTVHDARGNEIGKGTAPLNAMGGFDFSVKLPATMDLGTASIALRAAPEGRPDDGHSLGFRVEEFRRPEFEVSARASEGPHIVGGHAVVQVAASYYAGGPLPDARVVWRVSSSPGSFTPPNRGDFTFGRWVPWWGRDEARGAPSRTSTHEARTNAEGTHGLRIDFDRVDPPQVTNLRAVAAITDVNRQTWSVSSVLVVHPSTLAVGLKSDRYFVQRGEPIRIEAIVVDLDGRAIVGRAVAMRAERLDWKQEKGTWVEKAIDGQDCAVTSGTEPISCAFKTPVGGTYRITARVADDAGRVHETQMQRWVAGGSPSAAREVEEVRATLVPNKQEYRSGDTAELLVMAPFAPAEGLLTLRRSGLLRSERFTMTGASHTLRIPIEGTWTPNVHVQVDLVGATPRRNASGEPDPTLPLQPDLASGTIDLAVPPIERTLALQVVPRARTLAPGCKTTIDLTLRDASGAPVQGAEAAVVVVDEAILSLAGYRIPDPIGEFYQRRKAGVADFHLRHSLVLLWPDSASRTDAELSQTQRGTRTVVDFCMMMPALPPLSLPRGRAGGGSADPLAVRSDFSALALFAASVPTDAAGRAEVEVTLPDTLTRYRVMAVAVDAATKAGSGESTITARLPLMVRPSPPRFLHVGDRAELPVVLQNLTDAAVSVDVAMRATNATLTAGQGRHVSVPANDRVEVRFAATATAPGTARFDVVAQAGRATDAAAFTLPVRTAATVEAFATYGQIDRGAVVHRVKAPPDAYREFGGLEITTSSTALQALTDAVLYLVAYPFECAEQVSSRVLAVAALKDVLGAFGAAGLPDAATLTARMAEDLRRLSSLRNADGGFALWRKGDESWPFVSIHAAHALARAKAKGFLVRDEDVTASLKYLQDIDRKIPSTYGPTARRTLQAYALFVRKTLGDSNAAAARQIVRNAGVGQISFEALGWLLAVMSGDRASAAEVAAIRAHLSDRATETAGAAHFAVSFGDEAHLLFGSERRADAVVLDALITDQPQSDLVPKIVTGLLAHRRAGRWENTQENVFVLLALDRYFRTYEGVTPDFVARGWLGTRYAGEQLFKGRTTDRRAIDVPMRVLAETARDDDLVLSKDGPGRLYYRLGLRYAPRSPELTALDRGFVVERRYEGVDDPRDVTRDADGTWRIRAGARVRVRVSMVAPSRRYHVALVDPLPAGLEALNPTLATTGAIPPDPPEGATTGATAARPLSGGWAWTRTWFEHQNLRDDRVEAFTSLLWEGVYTYSYVARATTIGRFVAPPPRAEEMYHPETFGRGATDRIVIEDRPGMR